MMRLDAFCRKDSIPPVVSLVVGLDSVEAPPVAAGDCNLLTLIPIFSPEVNISSNKLGNVVPLCVDGEGTVYAAG